LAQGLKILLAIGFLWTTESTASLNILTKNDLLAGLIQSVGSREYRQETTATSIAFSCTNGVQSFEVPSGAVTMSATLYGASGYNDGYSGSGAMISANIPVSPGDIYYIYVGCMGQALSGGFNGGGMPTG
jgi:hypothetical protein